MELSVVIPVFNEETNIREVYQRVAAELESVACGFEIIFIDDGSTDSSVDQIASLHRLDPRVKLLSLSRNFGHQTALTAGMDHARGDAVIAMDADLQHPPALIGDLLGHWKDGYEVVYTVRKDTRDATTLKRWSAKFFYRVFSALSGIDIPANSADFRLLDRRVVEAFRQIRERTRFLRGLVSWAGFRSIAVPYDAPARHSGTSKYSTRRMMRFAIDALVSFSATPLYMAIYVGALMALLGCVYMFYVLYARLVTGNVVPGWTSLIILVSFVGGIQLIIMGIIGVYIGKIYEETKQRPLYLIRDTLGLGNTEARPARVPFSESAKS
jgi:polyisoprenyl-phosphate glycosyltransferase